MSLMHLVISLRSLYSFVHLSQSLAAVKISDQIALAYLGFAFGISPLLDKLLNLLLPNLFSLLIGGMLILIC